jgi:hypothetical protein
MIRGRRSQRKEDTDTRLQRAEAAQETVAAQGERVERQLSFVGKLSEGWRRVHEQNHLAQLFHDEGRI